MVREICGRQPGDPTKKLDVNLAIWWMFMNTTVRAAVHLGKDNDANLRYAKNHIWKTAGKLFSETEKAGQWSARNHWHKHDQFPRSEVWSTSLLYNRAYQYSTAKAYVFSDSVLCLVKMAKDLMYFSRDGSEINYRYCSYRLAAAYLARDNLAYWQGSSVCDRRNRCLFRFKKVSGRHQFRSRQSLEGED